MIEPTIKSKRLHLELITLSDLAFIHDLLSHEVTDRYNALGIPESLEETIHAHRKIQHSQLLVLPSTMHPIERVDVLELAHQITRFFRL